jgi:hypothetical protein
MNFFFSFKNYFLQSKLTIPRFDNSGKYEVSLKVFEAKPDDNQWKINQINCEFNENFYFIDEHLTNNESIFFLAKEEDIKLIKKNNFTKLVEFNSFTRTSPVEYRSNLKISIPDGGFSSYQSDYPFSMIKKKGSILSPVSNLLNKNSDKNMILIRNIFEEPIREKFNLFFVDLLKKKVLKNQVILTNFTNEIVVDSNLIEPNVYIYTDKYLGIPIYLTIKNKHISFEHTHPPHHYILSGDKFKKISDIKKEVHEIVNT